MGTPALKLIHLCRLCAINIIIYNVTIDSRQEVLKNIKALQLERTYNPVLNSGYLAIQRTKGAQLPTSRSSRHKGPAPAHRT